jgi:hypothetical protein
MPVPTTVREPEDTGREEALEADEPTADDPPLRFAFALAHHLGNAGVVALKKESHIFDDEASIFVLLPQDSSLVFDVTEEQSIVCGEALQKLPDPPRLCRLEGLSLVRVDPIAHTGTSSTQVITKPKRL